MIRVECPYCKRDADLVDGRVIYPRRPDLRSLMYWFCRPCDAYTGTHRNSREHKPKGRLANQELREARIAAHAFFDPRWASGRVSRREAYAWLRQQLGAERTPHIGFMDVAECERVVQVCRDALRAESRRTP